MTGLSTHILDTSKGQPAVDVAIVLEYSSDKNTWREINRTLTNADGRVSNLLPSNNNLQAGFYRLTFDTSSYFSKAGITGFYPWVTIIVEIKEPCQHYHVPLLISPFAYSTYRGS